MLQVQALLLKLKVTQLFNVSLASDSPVSDSDTLDVVVSTAKKIGVVSVEPTAPTVAATSAKNFQCQVEGNIADATFQWTVTPADGTFHYCNSYSSRY